MFVVYPTEKVKHLYSNIVDDEYIMDCHDKRWVDKLINKMTDINSNQPNNKRKNIL